jgi:hypothetical protein
MGAIDLRDAYYSIKICPQDRKYLRFIWRNTLYQFTACPNGYARNTICCWGINTDLSGCTKKPKSVNKFLVQIILLKHSS